MVATANWYTQTAVKNILVKYQKWLIINPLNEAGYVMWNGNNATALNTLLQDASTWNVPIVLGEVANKQDDNNGNCTLTLDLTTTLQKCEQYKIGWLAWVWTADNCGSRQMTTNGNLNTLTAYGNQIINTSPYGLKFAKRAKCL